MLVVTDGITCSRQLESDGCRDISGVHLVQFLSLVGVHLQDTANTFLLALRRVQYVRTGVHGTGIHTEIS